MSQPLIYCDNISHRYGNKRVLNGLNLSVPAGAMVALVGPNGAGKTTLLNILCGYLRPSGGQVSVCGMAPGSPALCGQLAALPQDARLDPSFSVSSHLQHFARLQGFGRSHAQHEAERVLALVGLSDSANSMPTQLSHGMAKRVLIAQALLGEPQLVLLDEPTAGLDPASSRAIRGIINSLAGQTTFVISSHNLAELDKLCDTVFLLNAGQLQLAGDDSSQSEAWLNLLLPAPGDAALRQKIVALAGVEQVQEQAKAEWLIRYNPLVAPQLDIALLQLLATEQVAYRQLGRGKTLEQRLFS